MQLCNKSYYVTALPGDLCLVGFTIKAQSTLSLCLGLKLVFFLFFLDRLAGWRRFLFFSCLSGFSCFSWKGWLADGWLEAFPVFPVFYVFHVFPVFLGKAGWLERFVFFLFFLERLADRRSPGPMDK